MGNLRTGNALAMMGIMLVIFGGGFMIWTMVDAQSSTAYQIGQAFDVWPQWVFEQMSIGFVVAAAGASIAWYGLGHGQQRY
ncbi:hypothetical protein [Halobacterium sp. KA-6]|uniref:hypothetical protein n=1 Tax=Halobacterium sp. KA-6 TaxID=2896368 RepID=UPI001E515EC8|nr:hypothetical protein [Halobacterium sp. KA-6]MCD2202731.1 hypothetical protein [Halobacterium sp. KA-6]